MNRLKLTDESVRLSDRRGYRSNIGRMLCIPRFVDPVIIIYAKLYMAIIHGFRTVEGRSDVNNIRY